MIRDMLNQLADIVDLEKQINNGLLGESGLQVVGPNRLSVSEWKEEVVAQIRATSSKCSKDETVRMLDELIQVILADLPIKFLRNCLSRYSQ